MINLPKPVLFDCKRRGFSLLELAIVLGVVGLLLAGLFQLTTASTRQINNQITAQQLQLYNKAVNSWLITARVDANGTQFYTYTATGASSGTLTTAVNQAYDVTTTVQGFKQGNLPLTAPNGGTYKTAINRTADVGGQASYFVVTSIIGGQAYDRVQLGSIATFVGAQGGSIFAQNQVPTTAACNGTTGAIIGAFGATCISNDKFVVAGFEANRPAGMFYINLLDASQSDTNYLWRVSAANSDLNKMTVDLGMKPNVNMVFDGAGNITMGGGLLSTGGGQITTGGGAISTINAGGTSGGDVNTGGGTLYLGKSAGIQMSMSVNPSGYLGVTPSVYMPNYMEGGGANFSGTVEANGFNAQQFIYVTSDRTLKKDIQDLHDVLPSLARLNGKRYTLRSSDHTDLGLIAQDVQDVFPELVAEHNGHLVMNYQGMVAPLLTGINELAAENASLNDRVTRLESLLKARAAPVKN